jgi:N12 class adenine-specific DNA methylase
MSFSDWTKKRKQQNASANQDTTKEQSGTQATASVAASSIARDDKPSSFGEWTRKSQGEAAWRDEEVGFNDWLDSLSKFFTRMSDDYSKRDGVYQSADTMGTYLDDTGRGIDALSQKSDAYKQYFTAYKSMYDELYGEDAVNQILSSLDEGSKYLSNVRESLNKESDYWAQFQDQDAYDQYQKYLKWQAVPQASDFAEKSQYKTTYNPDNEHFNAWTGTYTDTGFGDVYYDYINGDETAQSRTMLNDVNAGGPGSLYATTHDYWKDLPEDVVKTFNYIYATEGSEAAYEYIGATIQKTYTGIEALGLGFLQGTGTASLSAALGKAYAGISGDDEAGDRTDDWYNQLLQETAAASTEHPGMATAGQATGTLSLMAGIATGIGAIEGFSSLPAIAQSIISGGASLGGTQAIQGIGGAATGNQSWGDYALDVGTNTLSGAAGGALSSGIGTWGTKFLQGKGLAGNQLARTVVAGLSGTGFVSGSNAVSQPAEYLRDPENYEFDMSQFAEEALVGFAFSAFGYLSRNYTTDPGTAAQMDADDALVNKYFKGMTQEEATAAYRQYAKQYHPDLYASADAATQQAMNATMAEVNAAYARFNVTHGAAAYQAAQEAKASGNTTAYEQAASEFQQSAAALQAAATQGGLATAETAEAAQILNAVASGMAGGMASEAVTGAVPAVTEQPTAPAVQETTTPAPTAQEITTQLVQAGVEPTEAESLGSSMAALMNGEEISGNKAGAIAENEVAVSILENTTGQQINTDAPLSEVKAAIRSLASPAETQEAAPAGVDTALEERAAAAAETAVQPSDIDAVRDFASTLEKAGSKALTTMFNDGQNAADYVQEMMQEYNAGRSGAEFTGGSTHLVINQTQAEAAYLAGQADAHNATETVLQPSEKQGTIKAEKKTFVPAKKADWAAHDVQYFVPGKKTPIAYSTISDRDLLGVLADAHPDATISDLRDYINYGEEAKRIVDAYVANGYGDENANKYFTYDGNKLAAKVGETVKEDTTNGRQAGADRQGVRPSEAGNDGTGSAERRGGGLRDGGGEHSGGEPGAGRGRGAAELGTATEVPVGNERIEAKVREVQSGAEPSGNSSGNDNDVRGDGGTRAPATGEKVGAEAEGDAGRVEPAPLEAVTPEQQSQQKADLANQEQPKGNNFVIQEKGGVKIPTTPKSRYTANVAAIKTLRNIMAGDRLATPAEQEILAKYTGWGGISNAFDGKNGFEKEFAQLQKLLDDGEYKTAKASILDAYFTEPEIIRAMYNGLASLGFTGGRLLEPSAGVGRFIGAMPQDMLSGVRSFTAVELDKITGSIAKYLYPNADVRVQGFEAAKIPQEYMDVAIGNVPFGNIAVADKAYPAAVTKSIHNYFIAKSLDKVRPGGIATFITSTGTMDAENSAARDFFMKQADLIGAIRLPNTAFQSAGTPVVTDILVFKKREAGTPYKGEAFTEVGHKGWTEPGHYGNYAINEYFIKHPEMLLGKAAYGTGQYGRTIVTYDPLDSRYSLQTQIERAFAKIDAKMEYPVQKSGEEIRAEIKADAGKAKPGTIVKKNGKFYKAENGALVETADIAAKDAERMTSVLEIRDTARKLLDAQVNGAGAGEIDIYRKNLNTLYDAFVKEHGILHKQGNQRLVSKDGDSAFIMALEDYNKDTGVGAKAAIFTKNTVAPIQAVTHADSVDQAMTITLNESGTVDLARIAQLTGGTVDSVKSELLNRELAYLNRNGDPEPATQYLSGNVRAKLRDAEALAEADPAYKRNVDALKKVIPADIAPEDVSVRLGATWIPDSVYSQFASEMLGGGTTYDYKRGQVPSVEVTYNRQVGKYFVTINDNWMRSRPENTTEWGTSDRPLVGSENASILPAALNNKTVSVWRTVGDNRVLDIQATQAAQEKMAKVLAEFSRWLWKDAGRRAELGKQYNDTFNNTVTPKYDGSNLTVNGSNPDMKMRPHQLDAVQRIISSGGNTLLAHRVGAGKTYEMAAAAMKLRQLGVVKKPVFIAPNHLVAQWGNEFLSYFPAAKIKVVEKGSLTAKNRKIFANQIATGDFDAVIMSYEQFEAIPMSDTSLEAFYQEQIDSLEQAILESKRAKGKDPSVRDMERSKKSLEAKLKNLVNEGKKDVDNIDFEQLGIDALFVDEAHNFKNLFYTTKMQGVADMGDKSGSQRALDLYMKVRYLQRLNGGRGIVFATATPVMNSVVELYTMQRYLQPDLLEAKGLTNFDAWVNQFGEVTSIRRMKPSGTGYDIKQSLSRYKNMAEMQQMFRAFSDVIVDAEELPYLDIPKMKGGKRIVVECEPGDFQQAFMQQLSERAESLKGSGGTKGGDHIFKIMGDGKMVSYSQHMINPALPYEDEGKIMKCVDNLYQIWKRSATFTGKDGKAQKNGTQLVFCDRGVPGGKDAERGACIYSDMKNLLVGMGVPEEQIAFIHDAASDAAKEELFKKVNDGDVRILIGSSDKMGTGMNVQKRIVALHELNAPDRPGDLEQNEGRALRQKNLNAEVEVYSYVTKRTFDSRQWDTLKRKAIFIHQVMSGNYTGREAAGDGDLATSAAEISAIASDNPLILEQFDISEQINTLENLERAHTKEANEAKQKIVKARAEIAQDEEYLTRYKNDLASRQDTAGDKFKLTLDGKTYDERKTAGEALIGKSKDVLKIGDIENNTDVGSFAGFKLLLTSKGDMLLRGEAQYRGTVNMQSAAGTIQALEAIPKRLDGIVANTQARLSENKASIAKLEKAAAAPFDRADELVKLRAREMEIMTELNPESNRDMGVDDADGGADLLVDTENTADTVSQEISSAKTSIKQIPALFKDKNVKFGKVNIDIGGGKFDLATDYLKSIGTLNLVFDPYNRSEAVNADTLNYLRGGYKADTATCANVLNVIKEPAARANVILETAKAILPNGRVYFMVYEGDGSGVGKETSSGWQNNRKTRDYMDEIRKYFRGVQRQGKLITATEPKGNLPKASWEVSPGKGVLYSKDVTNDGIPHPERWTAKRVGSSDTAPKPVSDIIAQIRHDFGLNVTYGHVRGTGVRGQFNPRDKGIRSRIANDLPTVCHELGHALDDRFSILGDDLTKEMHAELEKALGDLSAGYKEDQYDSEGLAEFLRQFLQNRETAAIDYPAFTKYLLGKLDGKTLATLEQLADDVNAYYSLDADSAESSVRLREEGGPDLRTHGEKIRQMGNEFYQAWIDANHGIKLFDEANGSSVYKLATNSAYSDAIAGRIITSDLTGTDGQYIGPGLKTVLHGVNTRSKKEYKAFGEYLIMRHGPEYLAEGKRVFADDRKNSTAWMQRRQMELEQQYPQFEAAAKRLYQFLADLNKAWGVETQVIGADQLAEWQQRWPNYVPFNRSLAKTGRAGAKRGYANQASPYKRAKGSGLDIVHPVDNIIDQIVLLVNVGVRNNVMYELRNAALDKGADASLMEKIPTPMVPKSFDMTGVKVQLGEAFKDSDLEADDKIMADKIISNLSDVMLQFSRGKAHGNVVTVMVNGKPEFWKINDKLLLESITSMTPAKLHGWLEAYAFTTRFMTANITGNNPVWSIFSNAPRDLGTFAVFSKDKRPFKALAAIGSGYVNAFNERFRGGRGINPLYAEYLAMGGGHTSAYSADADLARKARKKLTTTTAQRVLDTMNPVNWVTFISDTIEQGPRFATYKLMRQAGLSPQEAFYEAMDVTTNFRRAGYMSRDVNKAVPFFNASVQGIDKFNRYFTGEDAPKGERAKTVRNRWIAFFTASAILAAIMYALNSHDDESAKDYQQLSNYTKNSYWCIPLGDGKYFTIPKPRELAVMTSFFETCMESYIGGNDHAFDEFYDYATDNFLPSVVSDLAQLPSNIAQAGTQQGLIDTTAGALGSAGLFGVGAYMVANRDFLGKPIESATMQYLEPKDRYNSSTSKMAYWMGQAFNLSPAMVDYFGNQVLGYVWKVPRALFPVGQDPDYSLGVKSTYLKDNAYSQDLINWMYDQADGSAQAKKSDPENMDKAITAKLDSSMTDFYSNFNTLNRDKADTNERRHTRQVVLDMVNEYRKASESGETTAAQDAVYAVVRATGETSYMPSVMNTYVKDGNDVKYALTDEQYVTYQTKYLALYWDYAERNLSTGITTKEKAAILQAAKDVAKERATNTMLTRIGASNTAYATDYAGVADSDVIQFKAQTDLANDDGSLKQEEVIGILETMISEGLGYEDAYTLFHSRYDSDKNNPWKKYAP